MKMPTIPLRSKQKAITEYSLVTSSFSVGDTTTYCLLKNDGQIYVGTNAVADGENTIEISAEGYEDCTVTFTK